MTATARILQGARKMTPGTLMGQSRVATPCNCSDTLKPYGVASPACCYQQVDRINPDYVPQAGNGYAVPVQVGSVYNLCPAFTCEPGRDFAILGWVDRAANQYRIARVNPTADMFEDDSVSMGDVRVVWSSGSRSIHTGCISVIDGYLYVFISSVLSNNGLTECYVADDVENPQVWTLRGTIQSHTAPNPFASSSVRNAGPPTITPTGRWLLPFHGWVTFAASALEDAIGLHISDDQGVTWTTKVSFRKGALFGGSAGQQSTTITWDPISNQYVFGSHVGPTTQWLLYTSSDNGTTWGSTEILDAVDPYYYASTGLALYAARQSGTDMVLYRVGNPAVFATWTALGLIGIDGNTTDADDGFQIIPMVSSCGHEGMVFTMKDRITRDEIVPVYGRPVGGNGGLVGSPPVNTPNPGPTPPTPTPDPPEPDPPEVYGPGTFYAFTSPSTPQQIDDGIGDPPPGAFPVRPGVVYTQADIDDWAMDSEYTALANSARGAVGRAIQNPGTQVTLAQLAACRDDSVWAKTQAVLYAIDGDAARLTALQTYFENYRSVITWERNTSNETQRLNAAWILDNMTQAASIVEYSDPDFDGFLIDACLRPGVAMADALLDWPINPNWHASFAAARLGIVAHVGVADFWDDARAYYSLRLSQSIYHATYDGGTVQPMSGGSVTQHWNSGGTQINAARQPVIAMPNGTNAERLRDHGHVCLGMGGWVHGAFTILAQGETMTTEDHARLVAGLNYHASRVDPYIASGTQVAPWPGLGVGGPEYQQSWFPAKRYTDLTAETGSSLAAIVTRGAVLNYSRSGANHLVAERKADG